MMRLLLACLICLAPAFASAQQMPQTIEQRIGAQIGALVIQNAQLSMQIEMLQQKLAEAQAKLAEQKPAAPTPPK